MNNSNLKLNAAKHRSGTLRGSFLTLFLGAIFSATQAVAGVAGVTQVGTPGSKFTNNSFSSTDTLASFTVPAGNNRVLIVAASDSNGSTVTNVTFNGLSLTKAAEANDGAGFVDTLWYLALGSSTSTINGPIVVTCPPYGGFAGNPPDAYTKGMSAAVFINANQTTPTSSPKNETAIHLSPNNPSHSGTLTVTSSVGDLVLDVFDSQSAQFSPTNVPGSGQTVLVNNSGAIGGLSFVWNSITTSTKPGAPLVNTSWSFTGTGNSWLMASINIQKAAAAVAPTITSPTSTSVLATTATLGGNVTSDGGDPVTERGVVYSVTTTNANPATSSTGVTKVIGSGTTGGFTVPVTGLAGGTGYSYAAYATNSVGTTYTSVDTFTTTASDTTKPFVSAVVRQTPSTQPLTTATTTVTFRVTYSETVTGVVAANFQIENINGGTITGTIGTPTGSTNVYDVPVTLTGGSGEFRLKVVN